MSRSNVNMVLGLVRAAQGRDDEAELLLREAIDLLAATDLRNSEPEPLAAFARFLRERGRGDGLLVIPVVVDAGDALAVGFGSVVAHEKGTPL